MLVKSWLCFQPAFDIRQSKIEHHDREVCFRLHKMPCLPWHPNNVRFVKRFTIISDELYLGDNLFFHSPECGYFIRVLMYKKSLSPTEKIFHRANLFQTIFSELRSILISSLIYLLQSGDDSSMKDISVQKLKTTEQFMRSFTLYFSVSLYTALSLYV